MSAHRIGLPHDGGAPHARTAAARSGTGCQAQQPVELRVGE